MSRNRLLLALKLAVSAGLIWVLYHKIPLSEFRAHAAAFRPAPLAIIFALLLLNTLLSSWKWQILLRADGIVVPLQKLFTSYLVATFCNLFLPSSIGGDAYRVYDIARYSERGASRSFASVLADRLSGFLALVTLALIASVPVALRTQNAGLIALPLIATAAIVTALICLSNRAPARLLLRLTRLERIPRVTGLVDKVLDCFDRYQREPAVIARIMAIAFVFQFSVIVCVRLLAACLNIDAPFRYFAAFVPLISLMEALPISIYGIGVRDVGYAFFFAFAGLTPTQTRALALLYLITTVLYSLLGGLVFLFARRNPPRPAGTPPMEGI